MTGTSEASETATETTITRLAAEVATLTARLQRLEDEAAVRAAIMRYGLHVDVDDAEGAAATFTPDATYDVDFGHLEGRAPIVAYLSDRPDRAGRTADLVGPELIAFPGPDHATATGYSMVLVRRGDDIDLWRASLNHWELTRGADGAWLVARRTTRPVGAPDAPAVLRRGLPA